MQLVLARRVGEVRDPRAVGRPRRRALVGARSVRQVAGIALLGGHGHDLASVLEHRARARWRNAGVPDVVGPLHEPRARFAEIRRHADGQLLRRPGGRIEEVQPAGLLVDDLPAAGRRLHDREIVVVRDAAHPFRRRVVGVEVELAVAIRAEVDRSANPHRVDVVRASLRLRHLLDPVARGRVEPQLRDAPAAVLLPLLERLGQRHVRDSLAVGRVGGLVRVRDRQLLLHPASHRHGVEMLERAGERRPARREQDGPPVRREALNGVGAGMPGQPLRHATGGRNDVHVRIAVVLRRERQQHPVRRERRTPLHAIVRRQAPEIGPVQPGDPEVVGVHERDVRAARRGLGQQARVARARLGRSRDGGDERGENGRKGESAEAHDRRPPGRGSYTVRAARGAALGTQQIRRQAAPARSDAPARRRAYFWNSIGANSTR